MKIKVNKRIKGITIAAAALVLIIVVAVMFIIVRYTPAKEKMSGYTYYGIDRNTDKVFVIIDGELYPDTGIIYEGRYYLPQEFIADNINVGFYYDTESDAVLYSDSKYMYTYKKGENVYTDDTGKTYNTDYSVVVESEGKCYVNWEYVAEHTDCEYEYGNEPERINITLEREEKQYVTAQKKTAVRYRGGIKSPVLEYVQKGDRLVYEDDLDDWIKVTTATGYTGYIKKSEASDTFAYIREEKNYETHNYNMKDDKITLAWFQVSGVAGNSGIDNNIATASGVNVLAPTWYSVTDSSGNMSCYASAGLVNKMHQRGTDVWALVSDFDTNVDFAALYYGDFLMSHDFHDFGEKSDPYFLEGFGKTSFDVHERIRIQVYRVWQRLGMVVERGFRKYEDPDLYAWVLPEMEQEVRRLEQMMNQAALK